MMVSKRERAKSVGAFLKKVSSSEQRINSSDESFTKDEETIIASEESEGDHSFKMLLKRAEEGDAEAQNELGDCYYYGKKVGENRDLAFMWYMMAAKQGNPEAQFNVGWCYARGKGTEVDNEKAVEWYKKSAEQGNADAQHYLSHWKRKRKKRNHNDEFLEKGSFIVQKKEDSDKSVAKDKKILSSEVRERKKKHLFYWFMGILISMLVVFPISGNWIENEFGGTILIVLLVISFLSLFVVMYYLIKDEW